MEQGILTTVDRSRNSVESVTNGSKSRDSRRRRIAARPAARPLGAASPLVHPRTQHMLLSARIEFHHMVSVDFFECRKPTGLAGEPLEALVEQ